MVSTAYSAIQLPDYVKSLESLPPDSGLRPEFRKATSTPPVVEEKNSWEKACAATKTPTLPDITKTSHAAQDALYDKSMDIPKSHQKSIK